MDTYSVKGVSFDLIDVDDSTQRETVPGNTYEPAVTDLIHDVFTRYGLGTFLDVGALYGYFSCYVAKLAPNARVVAFEPSRRSAAITSKNFELNGLANASVETVALTSGQRRQEFVGKTLLKDKFNDGPANVQDYDVAADLRRRSRRSVSVQAVNLPVWLKYTGRHLLRLLRGWNRKETVECVPFDERYGELTQAPVVVKIDVHGAEVSVLRGMQRYLKECVDVLFLEMHRDDMLIEGSHVDTVALLKSSGLALYEVVNFRSDEKWRLQRLGDEELDALTSSKRWSLSDQAVMKMVLGIREGAVDVRSN